MNEEELEELEDEQDELGHLGEAANGYVRRVHSSSISANLATSSSQAQSHPVVG
jgi:hypothetical protein